MEKIKILSDNEIHSFGINIVLDDIRKNGFIVVSVESDKSKNPQIIATLNGQTCFILVRTACYPYKGKIESRDLGLDFINLAKEQDACCYFASIGIANANGTTDLEMSIPLQGSGFYIAYNGLEEFNIEKVFSETTYIHTITYNQSGDISGSDIRLPDGRHSLKVSPKSDMSTMLMSICLVFAEDLNSEQRITFSKWAHLPINTWSQDHNLAFTNALLHLFMELKTKNENLPPSLTDVIKMLTPQALPPHTYTMTNEIRGLLLGLFNL